MFALALALATAHATPLEDAVQASRTNLLVIVADDVGVDKVGVYANTDYPTYAATAVDLPVTPTLDTLAARGLRFTRAWANPSCSPTRAAMLTGRHGFRTGVLSPADPFLEMADVTLPEVLDQDPTRPGLMALVDYDSGVFGKWHLGEHSDVSIPAHDDWTTIGFGPRLANPLLHGFDRFMGHHSGALADYWSWERVSSSVGGTGVTNQTYATFVNTDDAAGWIGTQTGPWLAIVNYNAAHDSTGGVWDWDHGTTCLGARSTSDRGAYAAMVGCIDSEIARLLDGTTISDTELQDTLVVFVGDNGTHKDMIEGDFVPDLAVRTQYGKTTSYETGIRVPLIFADGADWITAEGRPLPGTGRDWIPAPGVVNRPTHVVDLFDTLLDVSGLSTTSGFDSHSLVPYFTDPGAAWHRAGLGVYAEMEGLTGGGWAALAGQRWKLVVRATTCRSYELYKWSTDPFEANELSATAPGALAGMKAGLMAHPVMSYDGDADGVPDSWLAVIPDCP